MRVGAGSGDREEPGEPEVESGYEPEIITAATVRRSSDFGWLKGDDLVGFVSACNSIMIHESARMTGGRSYKTMGFYASEIDEYLDADAIAYLKRRYRDEADVAFALASPG